MTDYKQLCINILRYWDAAGTPSDFIDTNGYGTIQRIRAALAKSKTSEDMSDSNHPITVPAGSITGWKTLYREAYQGDLSETEYVATQAARWGADQELEACCAVEHTVYGKERADWLRRHRRPKPPSLKGEVKQIIDCLIEGDCLNDEDALTLRRALESLPD